MSRTRRCDGCKRDMQQNYLIPMWRDGHLLKLCEYCALTEKERQDADKAKAQCHQGGA